MSNIVLVALWSMSVIGGSLLGLRARRDTQKHHCPTCPCRECCNIGRESIEREKRKRLDLVASMRSKGSKGRMI